MEEQRRGTSVAAIKLYTLQKYPMTDSLWFKHLLKQVLAMGLHCGLLIRPTNSKACSSRGGGSKIVPEPLARKIEAPKGPRRLACPPRPHHPNWPVGRQWVKARTGVETRKSYPSFYSPKNCHSVFFIVTYLSINTSFSIIKKR